MPRAGLSQPAVVEVAVAIVDEDGPDALTLAAVAERAGVATPSLYKHVRGLAELRSLVALRALGDLTDGIADAVIGRAGDDAVRATMHAYRAYVVAHPGRYNAIPPHPMGDDILAPVAERLLRTTLAVLAGYRLEESAAIHAARCLRSAVHGFAVLEAAGGFGLPEDLDESYDRLIGMVITGVRAYAAAARPPD